MRVAVTMLQCWHPNPGGTARSAIEQARAVQELAGDIELVGVGPWGLGARGRPAAPGWAPPMPVRHLPGPQQLLYESWHRFRLPPVQWATGRVDLVHATTITVPPRRGVPLAVTVHDLFPIDYPDQFTDRGRTMMQRGIELARAEADVVLCPSQATLDRCRAEGFEPTRLRHVPWGVRPVEVTEAQVAAVRQRHGLDGPFVLWVGTVEPRKNLQTLVEAFRRLPVGAGRLVLAGSVGWLVDLDALLRPIRDRVTVLMDGVTDDELAALNAAATVAALPSHAEGFGLTALEAMVQGTPVVVSSGSASEEVVGDAGVVVDATDVDGWATALAGLLEDADRTAELGERGRTRAGEYTWQRCAEATVAAYRSVA